MCDLKIRTTRAACAFALAVSALALGTLEARQQPQVNRDAATLADFKQRTEAYLALQKQLAAKVGELDSTKTPQQIAARETALAEAIRAARKGAKRGDIFAPRTVTLFKRIILEEFAHRSRLALAEREDAQDELPNFIPSVNQVYPAAFPLATFPPGVLTHLPPLPKPLEYRFVQQYLIIRDSEANLIIDVLPAAAPTMRSLSGRGRGRGRG